MGVPHPIDRAYTRYGLKLGGPDLRDIVFRIQNNEGRLVAMLRDKKTAWAIEVQGKLCKIVMSADFYTVLTFLPPAYDGPQPDKPRERAFTFYKAGKKQYGARRRVSA